MFNVPKLRFGEFEGEWVEKLVEDIAKRGSGHTPNKKKSNYYNGGIKWVSLADSNLLDNGYIEQTKYEISKDGIKNSSAVLHLAESVLLSRDAGVGKSAVMKIDMAVSQHFIVWKTHENILSNWFFYYKLQILKREFERIAVGSTIKTIGLPYFKKMKMLIPSFLEQQKIAIFLTSIDQKIEQLIQKKNLLESYKKGLMQKIFSNDKDLRIGRLKDFGYFYYGKSAPKWSLSDTATIPCVRYGELYNKYGEYINEIYSYTTIDRKKLKFSKGGEILVPRVGEDPLDFANCSYLPMENIAIGEMISVYNTDENGLFMTYYINAMLKYEFAKVVEGGNVSNLYFKYLENIIIKIPSIEEQQKIATFLTSIDQKISQNNQALEQMKAFKKGLLQQMFV